MLMEAWVYGSEVTTPITLDNAVFVFVNTIYIWISLVHLVKNKSVFAIQQISHDKKS